MSLEGLQPIVEGVGVVGSPLIMAGPCSAETEEQTLSTARRLAMGGVKVFRAGIWKPRTKPGGFEGIGKEGLQWLKRVKEETGMLVATEVAMRRHVEEALEAGVDILWIGARTSANPFAVQEIADALKDAGAEDVAVLVKNPVNPDLGRLNVFITRGFADSGRYTVVSVSTARAFTAIRRSGTYLSSFTVAFRNSRLWLTRATWAANANLSVLFASRLST